MECISQFDVPCSEEAEETQQRQHGHSSGEWVRNKDARRINFQRTSLIECVNFGTRSYISMSGLKTHILTIRLRLQLLDSVDCVQKLGCGFNYQTTASTIRLRLQLLDCVQKLDCVQ